METKNYQHTTVLLQEAVEALLQAEVEQDAVFVDGTFGRGGHSRRVLQQMPASGRLIAFDKDVEAIAEADTIADARFSIRHEGFSHLAELPAGSIAGVLLDLGVSSPQIDSPERGFSFRFDGPLDMRMDTTRGQSVAEWLQEAETQQIAEVIRDFGEERFAGPIAKAIVARREERGPLATTAELADLVAGAVKTRESGQNPATRTFQALRIFINAELEELQQALEASLSVLQPGGRLVVISFHSLEDRIVKHFMAQHAKAPPANRRMPVEIAFTPTLRLLGGAQKAGTTELAANPRARSAVLRVAEKLAAPMAVTA